MRVVILLDLGSSYRLVTTVCFILSVSAFDVGVDKTGGFFFEDVDGVTFVVPFLCFVAMGCFVVIILCSAVAVDKRCEFMSVNSMSNLHSLRLLYE